MWGCTKNSRTNKIQRFQNKIVYSSHLPGMFLTCIETFLFLMFKMRSNTPLKQYLKLQTHWPLIYSTIVSMFSKPPGHSNWYRRRSPTAGYKHSPNILQTSSITYDLNPIVFNGEKNYFFCYVVICKSFILNKKKTKKTKRTFIIFSRNNRLIVFLYGNATAWV